MAEQRRRVREKTSYGLPDDVSEHWRAARAEMCESIKALLPPEFLEHRMAARREALLAARSLIDHVLKRMETKREA